MDAIFDQSQDQTGHEIHRITNLYEPPAFVKDASYDSICGDVKTLPIHVYADPRSRKYPCHTASATWMSAAFFADKQASHQETDVDFIKDRVHKAADFFGIRPAVDDLFKQAVAYQSDELSRLPDNAFAFIWEQDGKVVERHMPVRNTYEVKAAAAYLQDNRDEFTYLDRLTTARRILSKGNELGADISEYSEFLDKQAGNGACSGKTAAALLDNRAAIINNAEMKSKLREASNALQNNPAAAHSPLKMQKLAAFVDDLDRAEGIFRDYGPTIPRPEDALFVVNEKTAAAVKEAHISMTSGNIYKTADLQSLQLDDVRTWMGTDFADEVSAGGLMLDMNKLAELLPTLPRGDAEHFDRLLFENGVQPFAKEAAHEDLGLSRRDLLALATAYDAKS